MIFYKKMKSPIGVLHLLADNEALTEVVFEKSWDRKGLQELNHPILEKAAQQLKEYFSGKRKTFDISLRLEGTDFQKKVWKSLESIPYGTVISYSEQAKRIQKPKATRCVGATNGKNPLPIIIPCHRVIGANGSLTGFGGGLDAKRYLLELEGYCLERRSK